MNPETPTGRFEQLQPGDSFRVPWAYDVLTKHPTTLQCDANAQDSRGNWYYIPYYQTVIHNWYTEQEATMMDFESQPLCHYDGLLTWTAQEVLRAPRDTLFYQVKYAPNSPFLYSCCPICNAREQIIPAYQLLTWEQAIEWAKENVHG